MKALLPLFLLLAVITSLHAQIAKDVTVPITVTTSTAPVSITLSWPDVATDTAILVGRKAINANNWQVIASLNSNVNTFTDRTVAKGEAYEYIIQQQGGILRNGFVYAGVEVNPVFQQRGHLLLVLDQTLEPIVSTNLEIWKTMVRGDGWALSTVKIDPKTATVASVKQSIKNALANKTGHKAILLFGDIPVPYSGNIAPDGHPDHGGAWPADYFYGDFDDQLWTDTQVNTSTASRNANKNIPGDGKFDQSFFPSSHEAVVGRVDFSNLPNFDILTEQLYNRYLVKNLMFRQELFVPASRMLIDDNFGYFGGEAFAQNGWAAGGALAGPANVKTGDFFSETDGADTWLMAYGCGGGNYMGAGGVGNSQQFKSDTVQAVFVQLFGSYFGDWDYELDPFMPSALASKGNVLTCTWSGRPNWFYHHLGMGEPMSKAIDRTWNNAYTVTYPSNFGNGMIHTSFLGDPTLRAHNIAPVTNIAYQSDCGRIYMEWAASQSPNSAGYHLYVSNTAEGPFDYFLSTPLNNVFLDPSFQQKYILVKTSRLEETPTGSYLNLSSGFPVFLNTVAGTPIGGNITQEGSPCENPGLCLKANAINGTSPYTYLWSNGSTTQTQCSLSAGKYWVTITDANGCTARVEYTLVEPPVLIATAIQQKNNNCWGEASGSVNIVPSGGTPPYQITGSAQTGLPAGTFTWTVTDADGCTAVVTATITQPQKIEVQSSVKNVTCFGGDDGAVVIQTTGGIPPFTYSIPGGAQNKLKAGNYQITVTDMNGCSAVHSFVVTQPAPLIPLISGPDTVCSNAQAPFTTTNGFNTYLWSTTNASILGSPNNPTILLQAGQPGTTSMVTLTVTDGLGCIGSSTATLYWEACTSVETFLSMGFEMYPNPAQETLYLNYLRTDNKAWAGSVLDVTGKVLLTFTPASGLTPIALRAFTPGNYFLRLECEGQSWVQGFVKM